MGSFLIIFVKLYSYMSEIYVNTNIFTIILDFPVRREIRFN